MDLRSLTPRGPESSSFSMTGTPNVWGCEAEEAGLGRQHLTCPPGVLLWEKLWLAPAKTGLPGLGCAGHKLTGRETFPPTDTCAPRLGQPPRSSVSLSVPLGSGKQLWGRRALGQPDFTSSVSLSLHDQNVPNTCGEGTGCYRGFCFPVLACSSFLQRAYTMFEIRKISSCTCLKSK